MTERDEELLESFAGSRDEAAFGILAGRYGGLVLHTALRRTGDRQMAEEVCQNVLCAMAKKAPQLAKDPARLVPWLHRATLYESHKAMRSESSYRRRKALQEAAAIPEEASGESPWAEAVPHLDVALDRPPDAAYARGKAQDQGGADAARPRKVDRGISPMSHLQWTLPVPRQLRRQASSSITVSG
jgi:DNA-directed RNA polymerase specialized sigma24 family protein